MISDTVTMLSCLTVVSVLFLCILETFGEKYECPLIFNFKRKRKDVLFYAAWPHLTFLCKYDILGSSSHLFC